MTTKVLKIFATAALIFVLCGVPQYLHLHTAHEGHSSHDSRSDCSICQDISISKTITVDIPVLVHAPEPTSEITFIPAGVILPSVTLSIPHPRPPPMTVC